MQGLISPFSWEVVANDREALAYFRRVRDELRALTAAYEQAHGPLTAMGATAKDSWDWVTTPWPWESEV